MVVFTRTNAFAVKLNFTFITCSKPVTVLAKVVIEMRSTENKEEQSVKYESIDDNTLIPHQVFIITIQEVIQCGFLCVNKRIIVVDIFPQI